MRTPAACTHQRAIRTAYVLIAVRNIYMSSRQHLSYMMMENVKSSLYFLTMTFSYCSTYDWCYLKTETEGYRRYTRHVCIYYPIQPPHISHIQSVISASKSFLSMQEVQKKSGGKLKPLLFEFPFWLSGSGPISERQDMFA
jgi:hypothetical protein